MELPSADSIQTDLPLKWCFPLTCCFGAVKIRTAFEAYLKKNNLNKNNFTTLEVYKKDSIHYNFIYGEEKEKFNFSKYPEPDLKK